MSTGGKKQKEGGGGKRGKNKKIEKQKKGGFLCVKFDWLVQPEWAAVEGKLGVMVCRRVQVYGICLLVCQWLKGCM